MPNDPQVIHTAHLPPDDTQEGLFTNCNDAHELVVTGPALIGFPTAGTGPAKAIPISGSLAFDATGALMFDATNMQSQLDAMQAMLTSLQTQISQLQLSAGYASATLVISSNLTSSARLISHTSALFTGLSAFSADANRFVLPKVTSATLVGASALTAATQQFWQTNSALLVGDSGLVADATRLGPPQLIQASAVFAGASTVTATGNIPLLFTVETLEHFEGANNSRTIIDETGTHTWSVVNAAVIDTLQAKFGASSLHLTGVNDLVTGDGAFAWGTGDFTIDFWINFNGAQSQTNIFDINGNTIIYSPGPGSSGLNFYAGGVVITGSTVITAHTWHHIALTRKSGTHYLFLDGNLEGTWAPAPQNYGTGPSGYPTIGQTTVSPNAWVDELRVLLGTAAWTSNFTPPATAYFFVGQTWDGAALLVGATTLSANATVLAGPQTWFGSAVLAGAATLAADATVLGAVQTWFGSAALAGTASLALNATVARGASVVLAGASALTASAIVVGRASAVLAGASSVTAIGSVPLRNIEALLHFDGVNGSATILDDANKHTWSAGGGFPVLDTSQVKFGTTSLHLTGSSDTVLGDGTINFGANPFTVDFWLMLNGTQSGQVNIFDLLNTAAGIIYIPTPGSPLAYYLGGPVISGSTNVTASVWHHIALTFDGGTQYLFLDGHLEGSWANATNYGIASASFPAIGQGGGFSPVGWVDELRILLGVCAWTSNFSVPTSAYGTFTATVWNGSALLAGAATLTAVARAIYPVSAAFAGAASLAADAAVSHTWFGSAALAGAASLAVDATVVRAATGANAVLAGTSSLTLNATIARSASALLAGSAALTANAIAARGASSALAGSGALTAAATVLPGVVYSALDPASNSIGLTFSNNNRTVTSSVSGTDSVRGTRSNNSGKVYFEVTLNTLSGLFSVGVCDTSFPSLSTWTTRIGFDTGGDSYGIASGSPSGYGVYHAGTAVGGNRFSTPVAGDVVGVAVDFTGGSNAVISFRVNGVWSNNGSPSSTLTASDLSLTNTTLYPAVTVSGTLPAGQSTINLGNAAFANALPPGYSAWT